MSLLSVLPMDLSLNALEFLSMEDLLQKASEFSYVDFLLRCEKSRHLGRDVLSHIFDNPPLNIVKHNNAYELFSFLTQDIFSQDYLSTYSDNPKCSSVLLLITIIGKWRPLTIERIFYYKNKILTIINQTSQMQHVQKLDAYNLWVTIDGRNCVDNVTFWNFGKPEDREMYVENLNDKNQLLLSKYILRTIIDAKYDNTLNQGEICEKYLIHYLSTCTKRRLSNDFSKICRICTMVLDFYGNPFKGLYNRLNGIVLCKFETEHYFYAHDHYEYSVSSVLIVIFYVFEAFLFKLFNGDEDGRSKQIELNLLLKKLVQNKLYYKSSSLDVDFDGSRNLKLSIEFWKNNLFWISKLFSLIKIINIKYKSQYKSEAKQKFKFMYQWNRDCRASLYESDDYEFAREYRHTLDILEELYYEAIDH